MTLFKLESDDGPYVCPRCGAASYNPHDKAQRYCGACKRFEDGTSGFRAADYMTASYTWCSGLTPAPDGKVSPDLLKLLAEKHKRVREEIMGRATYTVIDGEFVELSGLIEAHDGREKSKA